MKILHWIKLDKKEQLYLTKRVGLLFVSVLLLVV